MTKRRIEVQRKTKGKTKEERWKTITKTKDAEKNTRRRNERKGSMITNTDETRTLRTMNILLREKRRR